MEIKGIKRGKVIELLEEVAIPDDTEILIEVREISPMSDEERWEKMKAFLERPRTNEEIEEWKKIGEQLEKDREENRKQVKL